MPRKKVIGYCSIEGCERPIKNHGICQYHYNKKRLEEKPERAYAGLRGHRLYHIWFERKQANILCDRWLNFKNFIWDIEILKGGKPEGEFYLVRKNNLELYSIDNFEWEEHLRKKPNETNSDWWDRKLRARKEINPNLDSDRNIKRKYGLTREQYNTKLKNQNFVCAICNKPEKAFDQRTNQMRRLAVDHNHKTGKTRDLLCWRCNATIGKLDEDLDLVEKIKQYLIKYQETN